MVPATKAVGLAAENFRSHVRNAVNENRGLRDVIGTNSIAIADNHEVGTATSPSRRVASNYYELALVEELFQALLAGELTRRTMCSASQSSSSRDAAPAFLVCRVKLIAETQPQIRRSNFQRNTSTRLTTCR